MNPISLVNLHAILCLAPTIPAETKAELVEPTTLSPVSPELAVILAKWEQSSATTKTSKVKLTRTLYNLVFEEEKVAEAELYFQSPDQVRLDLRPAMVNRDDESQRIGKNGQPFRVVADRGETWIWTPKQLQLANDTDKTFEVMSIPNELKASKSPFASLVAFARAELFLPFLLDIHADQVRKDWTLSMKKNSGSSALLIAIPKSELSKACCSECWIVIDTTEWRTTAVKCFDQSGNIETVYKVNERKLNLEIPDSVFKPDLKAQGYQQVFPPESDP